MRAAANLGTPLLRFARGAELKEDAIACLPLSAGLASRWLQIPSSSSGLLYCTRTGSDHAWAAQAHERAAAQGVVQTLQADNVVHPHTPRPSLLPAWTRAQSSVSSSPTSTATTTATTAQRTASKPITSTRQGPNASTSARSSTPGPFAASKQPSAPTTAQKVLKGRGAPPTSASSPSPPSTSSAPADMEKLAQALIQPLPLGRVQNSSLSNLAIQVNRTLFLDPAKTLESTMRALYVIKRVLQDDGHVMVLNSNPLLQPLLREAALCCINSNMWFMSKAWDSETLAGSADSLFQEEHQPNRQLLAARGISMVNPHCMQPDVLNQPAPRLHMLDKWKLLSRRARDRYGAPRLLRQVVALENQTTRLPLPEMLTGESAKLRLLVVLDLSHDLTAVEEAYARNVMTVSLVNAHTDLSRITYPVYAGENHLKFQHFFLDWIIKVVNLPPPEPAE